MLSEENYRMQSVTMAATAFISFCLFKLKAFFNRNFTIAGFEVQHTELFIEQAYPG